MSEGSDTSPTAQGLASLPTSASGNGEYLGVEMIAAERRRQVAAEGWTPEHDDEHGGHELLAAAVAYAEVVSTDALNPFDWPWHPDWWKPSDDPIRNLVKAGALIAAEIDRLARAKADG